MRQTEDALGIHCHIVPGTPVPGFFGGNRADISRMNWLGANWLGANWLGANWLGANWLGA